MSTYVLAYRGGRLGQSEEERAQAMAAWGAWFEGLGAQVVDAGNPFGPATTVAADGSATDGGASALTGYSVISADSLALATDHAKACPVVANGGSVEVYEVYPVM